MLIPAHGNDFVYPYNPIYDYTKNIYHNCLVIMFLCFEIEDKIYPILFDYWISKVYKDENENYLSKDDIFIKSIEYLLDKGLKIENILFDSAFFHKKILEKLSKFKVNLVTRCPKSRVLESESGKEKAEDIFTRSYNGAFYYYHKYRSFLNIKEVKVFNLDGKIVGIANNKECLLEKKLYFLFTTNLELSSAKILHLYKKRWKIESFFKILKSYLSLSVFYRNDYDYVNERINLALSGFIIIQDIAKKLKRSFYQALKIFQDSKDNNLFFDSFNENSKLFIITFEAT
ncbi:MAG: transposase [Candidatus Sericytochromatia bacterium]